MRSDGSRPPEREASESAVRPAGTVTLEGCGDSRLEKPGEIARLIRETTDAAVPVTHAPSPGDHHLLDLGGAPTHYAITPSGETMLLLARKPLRSFLYRKIIAGLQGEVRCAAPDFALECGTSSAGGGSFRQSLFSGIAGQAWPILTYALISGLATDRVAPLCSVGVRRVQVEAGRRHPATWLT